MQRRDFLIQSTLAVAASLVPVSLSRVSFSPVATKKRDATWNGIVAELETQIPRLMQEFSVPGLSIALIRNAGIAWRKGFDESTMFEAASMSKPPFAYAVMKLCEKGVLNLDTPLTKYTPERFLQGDSRVELITARHCLSHTSGFQNWRSEKEPLSIHFNPGEKFMYSGEAYSYLESVVAHVKGVPFEVFMHKNLLVPFGMTESGYVWNDAFAKLMARPHDRAGEPMKQKKSTVADVARYGSSGALLSRPTDYAKFLIEVINPRPADGFRLNKASLHEMLRPQVKVQETDEYSVWWGLGWRIAKTKDGDFISHGGDNQGFHCDAECHVPTKSGFIIMTNSDGGAPLIGKFAPELAHHLYATS